MTDTTKPADRERLLRTHWMDLTDDEREIVREAERQVGHLTWCLGNTPEKACARKLAPVLAELTAARERIEALESELRAVARIAPCACTTGSTLVKCRRCVALANLPKG